MAWKKNTPEATRRFDELVAVPGAQREFKFGCPVYLLGEQRYAMLRENRVVLRLPAEHAAQLIAKGGRIFEPMKWIGSTITAAPTPIRLVIDAAKVKATTGSRQVPSSTVFSVTQRSRKPNSSARRATAPIVVSANGSGERCGNDMPRAVLSRNVMGLASSDMMVPRNDWMPACWCPGLGSSA